MMSSEDQHDVASAGVGQATVQRFRTTVTLASAAAVIVAVAGLLGYAPGLQLLGRLRADYFPMAPSAAVCLLIVSVALFFRARKPWQGASRFAMVALVLLVTVFGLLEAVELFVGIDMIFEEALAPQSGTFRGIPVGRRSPVAGASIALAGLGTFLLLLRPKSSRHAKRLGHSASSMGVLTALVAATVLLAYLYGAPFMYGGTTRPMAATAALAALFLGVALIAAAGPESFPASLVVGDSTATRLTRAFLPLVGAAVLFHGTVFRLGHRWFPVSDALLMAILAIVVIVVTVYAVTRIARVTGVALDASNRKVRESEARYRAITESANDAIVTTDSTGNIVGWNPGASTVFGYAESEAIGKPIALLMPERFLPGHSSGMSRLISGDEPRTIGKTVALTGVRKGGTEFPLELSLATWQNTEGQFFTGIVRDISARTQAAQELNEALLEARRFRDALDHVSSYVYMKDLQSSYTYANQPTLQLFHCPADELIGSNHSRFFSPEISTQLLETDSRVFRGEQVTEELDASPVEGERRVYLEVKSPIFAEPEGTTVVGLLGISTDITERKQAEEALASTVALLERTGAIAKIGGWELDVPTMELIWSQETCRLHEIDPSEVLTVERAINFYDPEARPIIQAAVQAAINCGTPFDLELPLTTAKGRPIWVRAQGSVVMENGAAIKLTGAFQDITARKRAEDALHESEERFRTLVEWSPEPLVVHRDGILLYGNLAAAALFGAVSAKALVGHSLFDRIHPDFHDLVRARLKNLPERGDKLPKIEMRFLKLDGTVMNVESEATAIEYDGAPAVLVAVTDITERKRATEERTALLAQLAQSQRLESLGLLAGGVAHDFNNMLAAILGYAELTMLKLGNEHMVSPYVEAIRSAAQRSADLTRQLLAFAREQTIAPRVLVLNDTIDSILTMLRRLLGERVRLVWMPGTALWNIEADPIQVDQVLTNLVVNAKDAMAEHDALLEVSTSNVVLDAARVASNPSLQVGNFVDLRVRDNGCGMDAHTLSRMFEPFFTTKEPGRGTGLGLSTVYGIMEKHGGFVDVESTPGVGTSFHLYFPRTSKLDSEVASLESPLLRGTETILLAEDEESVRASTAEMLQSLGYAVLPAQGGTEALALATSRTTPIHLLLTDVVMPGMNGAQVRDALRARSPTLKVLFMSGYAGNVISAQGVLAPGTHLIQKPFTMKSLAEAVRQALDD